MVANLGKLSDVNSSTVVIANAELNSYDDDRFMERATFTPAGATTAVNCMDLSFGSGSNMVSVDHLVDLMTNARSRMQRALGSDLEADDFNAELADLRQKYGGPVFDAMYTEYVDALELVAAERAYNIKFAPPAPSGGIAPDTFETLAREYNEVDISETSVHGTNQVRISGLLASDFTNRPGIDKT